MAREAEQRKAQGVQRVGSREASSPAARATSSAAWAASIGIAEARLEHQLLGQAGEQRSARPARLVREQRERVAARLRGLVGATLVELLAGDEIEQRAGALRVGALVEL